MRRLIGILAGITLAILSLWASESTPAEAGWSALAIRDKTGREYYVSPDGRAQGTGAVASPWDLASSLEGQRPVKPGDVVWVRGGTYKHPNRSANSKGYDVKLAGAEGRPVHVRAMPGERATIDGGLCVIDPAAHLWIWDLEIIVSELNRETKTTGSAPNDLGRPWGGLEILGGKNCKFIDLVIHDNNQGIGFWKSATDSEIYGCLIYDNGWKAPDRGHGHCVYTQNEGGTKTVAACILSAKFPGSYTVHAYGSSKAFVDNYLLEDNVAWELGPFLVGGGRPSHGIRVFRNYLYRIDMQIGGGAPENEDCEVRGNVILEGRLSINKYKKAVNENNVILKKGERRPEATRAILIPNKYDPTRANVVVFNGTQAREMDVPVGGVLKPGDRFRLLNPRDFFGKPVLEGVCSGASLRVPVPGDFAVYVLRKG